MFDIEFEDVRICCVYTFSRIAYDGRRPREARTYIRQIYTTMMVEAKIKGVESNHISLRSWLDISLTFTKLTIFFIRIISWATIINLITSKRFCNAVFIFAAQKLILAVAICAYFRPYCLKSQLSNRFVG